MKKIFALTVIALALAGCGTTAPSHVPESDDGLFLTMGQRSDYLMYGKVLDSKGKSHNCLLVPGFAGAASKTAPLFKMAYTDGIKCYFSNEWYESCFETLGQSYRFSGRCMARALEKHPKDAVVRFEEAADLFKCGTSSMIETFSDMGPAYKDCLKFTGDNFGRNLGGWLTPPATLAGMAGVTAAWPAWGFLKQTFFGFAGVADVMLGLGNGGLSVAEFPLAGMAVVGAHVTAPVRAVGSPLFCTILPPAVGLGALGMLEGWNLGMAAPASLIEFRPEAGKGKARSGKDGKNKSGGNGDAGSFDSDELISRLSSDQTFLELSDRLRAGVVEEERIEKDRMKEEEELKLKYQALESGNASERARNAREIVGWLLKNEKFRSFAADDYRVHDFFDKLLKANGITNRRIETLEELKSALREMPKE